MNRDPTIPTVIIFLTAIYFIVASHVFAQDVSSNKLNLSEIIEIALQENPELRAAQKSWEATMAKIPQAKDFADPIVSMMFSKVPGGGADIIEPNASMYRITQMLPFPGKRGLKEEIAKKGAEIAREKYEAKKIEIISKVKMAYYNLYMAYKAIEINEENVELRRHFLEVAQTKYATGQVPQHDVIKAQIELAKLINEGITLQQRKETAEAMLNILLNRQPQSPLGVPEDFELKPFNYTLEGLQQLAVKNRPELKSLTFAIEKGETMYALAKKNYYPNFMLMFERMSGQVGSGSWNAMIGINVPLFFKDKYDYKAKETLANIEASEASYEKMRNMTLFEVKDLLVKLQTAQRLENLLRTTHIPLAEQGLKAAETGYVAGMVDFLNLIESERMLFNFKLQHYQAMTNVQKLRAQLENSVGFSLE
ncbi:TPA: TolC family protein [Candidatus Poribacteria bacterium]|nr:TolC family protein [Candidatus Poribacteria bacterium]